MVRRDEDCQSLLTASAYGLFLFIWRRQNHYPCCTDVKRCGNEHFDLYWLPAMSFLNADWSYVLLRLRLLKHGLLKCYVYKCINFHDSFLVVAFLDNIREFIANSFYFVNKPSTICCFYIFHNGVMLCLLTKGLSCCGNFPQKYYIKYWFAFNLLPDFLNTLTHAH